MKYAPARDSDGLYPYVVTTRRYGYTEDASTRLVWARTQQAALHHAAAVTFAKVTVRRATPADMPEAAS